MNINILFPFEHPFSLFQVVSAVLYYQHFLDFVVVVVIFVFPIDRMREVPSVKHLY